jgi:hypothetical protein
LAIEKLIFITSLVATLKTIPFKSNLDDISVREKTLRIPLEKN